MRPMHAGHRFVHVMPTVQYKRRGCSGIDIVAPFEFADRHDRHPASRSPAVLRLYKDRDACARFHREGGCFIRERHYSDAAYTALAREHLHGPVSHDTSCAQHWWLHIAAIDGYLSDTASTAGLGHRRVCQFGSLEEDVWIKPGFCPLRRSDAQTRQQA